MGRYEELHRALAQARNERDIGTYLKGNLELIRVLNTHAWNCVLTRAEFPVGTRFRADFVILSACSSCWNCVLVEMQSPRDPIFTPKGEATLQLREAQRQVQDWEMYIRSYEAAFREQLADLARDEPAYCSSAEVHQRAGPELRDPRTVVFFLYKILIGRRASLGGERNQRRSMFPGLEIVTFDRLLDYARRLDAAELPGPGGGL